MNKTIVCLHGYGKRRSVQFNYLVDKLKDYNFVCPDYYSLQPNDIDYHNWLNRVDEVLNQHKSDEIIIIGFSLGAVIASYFANKYDVKKLILIGGSFEYDNFLKVKGANPESAIPAKYIDTFVQLVDNCANAIYEVECPITFIHAKGDEIIPYAVSQNRYSQCKNRESKLFLLDGGQHMVFDDEILKDKTIEIINNEII